MAEYETKLKIRAENATDAAFRSVIGNVNQLQDSFRALTTVFAAGGFAAMVKGAVDAADKLNDLNKTTGIAVERLSGLSFAAKASGSDLDGIASSINKLSVNIANNAEKFRALGVTASDPLEAFKQLADVFAQIKDPQLRAAVGAEALGKSWASAAPLLAEGGKRIGELVQKGQELSGVTAQMAADADEFNDKLLELGGAGGLVNRAIAPLLPLFNALAQDLIDARQNTGSLTTSFNPLLEAGKAVTVLFGNVSFVLRGVGNEIGGIAAQIRALATLNLGEFLTIRKLMVEDADAARKAFDEWEKKILAVGTTAQGAAEPLMEVASATSDAASAAARAFVGYGNATRALEEFRKEQERLRQLHARGEEAALEAQYEQIQENYRRDSQLRRASMDEAEKIRQMEYEGQLWLSRNVVAIVEQEQEEIARIQSERLREQQRYWQGFLGGIESAFRSTFDNIFSGQINNWRDFVSAMRDIFKRILLDFIYQALARPFVINLVAAGASSLGMSGLASAATSAAASGAGIGFATGAEFLAGATGTFMGPAAAGSAAAMGAQFAAFMTNPATLAVLAVVAIAVALRSRQGGPKEGGSFFGTFDAQGNLTGTPGAPGTQNGRFFTPSGSDQSMRDLGTSMGQAFATALSRLGGNAAGVGFGFGFDRDPRGSAPSRVSALVTDATGRVIYENINREAGRSEEDLQAALRDEANRALLAALQASELPQAIADILSSLNPYSSASEEIEAALAAAERIANLIDALAEIEIPGLDIEALRGFQRSGEELEQTFARVGGLWSRYVDLFTTEAERLQQAQDLVTSTFEELGVAVPDSMEAFKDLVAGLDLTTEAGRSMWERLMEIAPAFVAVQDAAARAAEAQREATRQMLQDAGISAEALAQIIRDGLLGRISEEEVGARMAEMVVGGIYNALANTYAAQITQIMLDGIITPMVTAATTGAAISAAASQASIDAMVAQVTALTEAFAELLNNPAFKEAMDRLREAISSVAGSIGSAGGYVPPGYVGGGGGGAPDNSTDRILNERLSLERRLLELQGNTVEIRRRELEALDPSNRALQEHIWRLEDEAKAAAKAAELLRQRGDLEIRIMELTGNSAGALAARRQLELAAADESLRPLLLRIYALEDEARAADEAAESMREIVSNIDALKEASDGVRQSISQLRETLPGFNVVGARQQDVRDAYGAFSTITDSTPVAERIRRAQAYQQALLASHSAQMAQLEERAQAERRAYEADLAARREAADAANQLTLAFRELGDFAKSILVGDQSPLSATERLAELQRQYAAALSGASAGNLDAINELPTLANARLQSARQNAATLVDYQRQALGVQRDLAALGERGNRDLVEVVDGGFTISAGLQQEMNKLTQETIDSLKAIDDVLQGWIEEQQAALEDQAKVFASINDGIVEMVLNTRGLDQRIADAIGRARQPASGQLQTPAGVSASRTRPSADTPASADDVRVMREELNAALIAVAQNTSKTARLLQRWEGDGLPDTRVVA